MLTKLTDIGEAVYDDAFKIDKVFGWVDLNQFLCVREDEVPRSISRSEELIRALIIC